jgi:hypothetical protein
MCCARHYIHKNPFLDLFLVVKQVTKKNVFRWIPDHTLALNETVKIYRCGGGHISDP